MWKMAESSGKRFKYVESSLDICINGLSMWEIDQIYFNRLKIKSCLKLMFGKRLKCLGNGLDIWEIAYI